MSRSMGLYVPIFDPRDVVPSQLPGSEGLRLERGHDDVDVICETRVCDPPRDIRRHAGVIFDRVELAFASGLEHRADDERRHTGAALDDNAGLRLHLLHEQPSHIAVDRIAPEERGEPVDAGGDHRAVAPTANLALQGQCGIADSPMQQTHR